MSKALVVYYSYSDTTRGLADKLAVFGKTNKGNNPYVVTWEE